MEKQNINNEAQFDLLPVAKSSRSYGSWDYSVVITGFAVATWCFLIGGTLSLYVGVKTAIIASISGNIISVLLMSLATSVPSSKYGVDTFTASSSVLGRKGTKVYLLLVSCIMVGWIIVLCNMMTRSVTKIVGSVSGIEITNSAALYVIGLLTAIICWLVAWKGPNLMTKMNTFVTPIFILIMIGLAIAISKSVGWGTVMDAKPIAPFENGWINFLIAFEASLGAGFSWWPNMGGLAKLCKTTRAAYWPNIIGLVFAATLGTALGTAAALVVGESDPTAWMVPLGGVVIGVIALFLLLFANIAANSVMIYNLGLGLKQIKFFLNKPWGLVTGFLMVLAIIGLIWAGPLYDRFYIILGIACMIYAPVVMIQLVDYFIFRKQKFDLRSLYNNTKTSKYYFWGGFNWVAVAVFAASIVLYMLILNPFTFVPESKLFEYFTATGAVCIFSGILYFVLGKIFLAGRKMGGYGNK